LSLLYHRMDFRVGKRVHERELALYRLLYLAQIPYKEEQIVLPRRRRDTIIKGPCTMIKLVRGPKVYLATLKDLAWLEQYGLQFDCDVYCFWSAKMEKTRWANYLQTRRPVCSWSLKWVDVIGSPQRDNYFIFSYNLRQRIVLLGRHEYLDMGTIVYDRCPSGSRATHARISIGRQYYTMRQLRFNVSKHKWNHHFSQARALRANYNDAEIIPRLVWLHEGKTK